MIKKFEGPIFYHHSDCDCIECDAKRQPGGLDFDPANDDAEFEDHEEEVMKEIEEGSIYKKRGFKKNQTIKFMHPSSLTGLPMILTGIIIGHGSAVRKMWPIEMAECPDDMLLIWRKDIHGNEQHYAVAPEDIIQEGTVVLKKEA